MIAPFHEQSSSKDFNTFLQTNPIPAGICTPGLNSFPTNAPASLEKDRCDPGNAGEGMCEILGEENLCAGPVTGTVINAEIQGKPQILQEQRKE